MITVSEAIRRAKEIAGSSLDSNGVRQALMLYGTDEFRLYAAALTIEILLCKKSD